MKSEIEKYTRDELIIFSVDIGQKVHNNGTYKKDIKFPLKWTDFNL